MSASGRGVQAAALVSFAGLVVSFVAACAGREGASGALQSAAPSLAHEAGIPAPYRETYFALSAELERFQRNLQSQWNGEKHPVTFGANLLAANAHRGEALLSPKTYQGVLLYLDRLEGLGIQGVTVSIGYPVLSASLPRAAEYWGFYEKLAQEVHRRGLKLHIERGVLFNLKTFTDLEFDYKGMSLEKYRATKIEDMQAILDRLHPDYLSIGNEPSVESRLTGLALTVESYTKLVREVVAALRPSGTLIGAGTGTWDDPAYVLRLARETDLDYIDLHLYPIVGENLQRTVELADLARAHGKKVIIGEAWLYKASGAEAAGGLDWQSVMARDVFSFWQPLDQAFLRALATLAHAKQIDYVSPFWSKYFFSYVDYSQKLARLPPKKLLRAADEAGVEAIVAGDYSATGRAYQRLTQEQLGK